MTDIEKVELKRDIQTIADHYGENQFDKCQEELLELNDAIEYYMTRIVLGKPTLNAMGHVNEEIADVEIMTAQLKLLLHSEDEVNKIKRFKVDRQLKRIEKEDAE